MTTTKSVLRFMVLCTVAAIALGPRVASSQVSYQWIGGDGNWSNALKWIPAGVPGASDTARVDVSGSYTVTVDVNVDAGRVVIGDDSTGAIVVDVGTFTLNVGSSLDVVAGGKVTTAVGATVVADSILVGGTLELRATSATADISVYPGARVTFFETGSLAGSIHNAGSVWIQGTWFAGRDADLNVDGSITNDGTLVLWGDHSGSVLGNATLTTTQPIVSTGRIQSRGSVGGIEHQLHSVLENRGELWIRQTGLRIDAADAAHDLGIVTLEDALTLRIDQTGTAPSVRIADSVSVDGNGELIISDGRIDIVDPSILSTGGKVTITDGADVHLAADYTLEGKLTLDDLSLNGPGHLTVGNGGALELIDVTLLADLHVAPGGRLDVRRTFAANRTLTNDGTTWFNGSWFSSGQVRASLSRNLTNNGTMVLWGDHSGSVIGDVELVVSDSLVNNGRLVTAGTSLRAAQTIEGILENRGRVILEHRDLTLAASGGDHVNADTIRIEPDRTLRVAGGAGMRNEAGSLLSGHDGTLNVTAAPGGMITTSGTMGPGMQPGLPGRFTVEGGLSLAPDAFFDVDLAGTMPGSEHDQLHVTSTLVLGGTLRIAFADTFDTAVGDTFNIATASSVTGTFDAVEQETQMGKHFSIVYDGTVVRLITLSGGVGIDEEETGLPDRFALHGAYPNPFNPVATVRFDLPSSADVTLTVFDVLGRQIRRLGSVTHEAGAGRTMAFEAGGLSSGLYLYRLAAIGPDGVSIGRGSFTLMK